MKRAVPLLVAELSGTPQELLTFLDGLPTEGPPIHFLYAGKRDSRLASTLLRHPLIRTRRCRLSTGSSVVRLIQKTLQSLPKNSDLILMSTDRRVCKNFEGALTRTARRHKSAAIISSLQISSSSEREAVWDIHANPKFERFRAAQLNPLATPSLPLYIKSSALRFLRVRARHSPGSLSDLLGLAAYRAAEAGLKTFVASDSVVFNHDPLVTSPFWGDLHQEPSAQDHLSLQRFITVFNSLISMRPGTRGILHILHADITAKGRGGTERHVDWLSNRLSDIINVIVSPTGNRAGCYLAIVRFGSFSHHEFVTEAQAETLIPLLAKSIDRVHLHHTLFVSKRLISALLRTSRNLVFTAHDFYLICPSYNLLTGPQKTVFCEAESDLKKCNRCLKNVQNLDLRMGQYRQQNKEILKKAERIIFPSSSTAYYFAKVFPSFSQKFTVSRHDLRHYGDGPDRQGTQGKTRRVVFLGNLLKHKGAAFALEAITALEKEYTVEVWGHIAPEGKLPKNLKIRPYSGSTELKALFKKYDPMAVFLPSIWAETFCYTFYETVLLSNAVPIVSKYGNPMAEVRRFSCGIVLEEARAEDATKAVQMAIRNRNVYLRKLAAFRSILAALPDYGDWYLSTLSPTPARRLQISKRQLSEISRLSSPSIT